MRRLSCRGTVRGETFADGVVERQGTQCDDFARTRIARCTIAGRVAVGRRRQAPVAGEDAPLPASIQDGVNRNDVAGLENAPSLAVLCTSTVRRRALFGTL
jgi:hypothetical protein